MPQAVDAEHLSQEIAPSVSLWLTTVCLRRLNNCSFGFARFLGHPQVIHTSVLSPFRTEVGIGKSILRVVRDPGAIRTEHTYDMVTTRSSDVVYTLLMKPASAVSS